MKLQEGAQPRRTEHHGDESSTRAEGRRATHSAKEEKTLGGLTIQTELKVTGPDFNVNVERRLRMLKEATQPSQGGR
jgi:hypothetical protein